MFCTESSVKNGAFYRSTFDEVSMIFEILVIICESRRNDIKNKLHYTSLCPLSVYVCVCGGMIHSLH